MAKVAPSFAVVDFRAQIGAVSTDYTHSEAAQSVVAGFSTSVPPWLTTSNPVTAARAP